MPSTHHGILLHVVFSTKQRRKLLDSSWREDLFAYMGGITHEHQATLLKAGGVEDHVHLLIKLHPSFPISETVKLIKGNSSRWINRNQKTSGKFEWQKGYGAFSVSESMAGTVKQYIANQEKHHQKQTFCGEYLALLKKHNIVFDLKFVFDDEDS